MLSHAHFNITPRCITSHGITLRCIRWSLLALTLLIGIGVAATGAPHRVSAAPAFQIAGCPDGYEPNDSLATAWAITPGSGSHTKSYICPVEDYWDNDWFRFEVPTAGRQIRINLATLPADYDLKLYDPSGVDVAASVRVGTEAEHISHVANEVGTWVIHVYAKAGASSTTDPYTLSVDLVAPTGSCNDGYEPNDSHPDAKSIRPNVTIESYLCPRVQTPDFDWFSVYARAGEAMRVELSGLTVDARMSLFEPIPSGKLIATSDGPDTSPEQIRTIAPVTGHYLIGITCGCDGDHLHPYSLIAEVDDGPACADANEPNDGFIGATTIQIGRSVNGAICAVGDQDFYRFYVTPRHQITVELDELPIDYDLELFDAQGQWMATSSHAGTEADSLSFEAGGTGPYFAKVYSWDGDFRSTQAYRLTVRAVAPPSTCGDAYEPNEDFASAHAISTAVPYLGVICDGTDEDWFRMSVTDGQEIVLRLGGQPSGDLPADYELALHGPTGDRVAVSQNSGAQAEEIRYVATTGGDYAIRVWGYNGVSFPSEYYALQLSLSDPDAGCPDLHEPNDVQQGATPLASAAFLRAYICDEGDVDWFEVSAVAGQLIFGYLSSLPADYELELYDGDLNHLAGSTNGGTTDEEIRHIASASGNYYFFVWGYQGAHDAAAPYTMLYRAVDQGGSPDPTQPPPTGCNEFFEPNDMRGQAHEIGAGIGQAGFICDADDSDWFRIDGDVGDLLDVSLSVPADFDLELRDGQGDLISRSAASGMTTERISHTLAAQGFVHLVVYGYAGAHDAQNPYSLNASITPSPPGCGEWFEPNEDQASAASLSSTVAQQGILCDANDQDWFDIPVAFGERLVVELTRLPADFDIEIYDPIGVLVAQSAAGGVADERAEWVATAAGRHAVRVFGFQGVFDASDTYLVEAIVMAPGAAGQPPTAPLPTSTASPSATATPWPTQTPTPRPKPTRTATPTAQPKATQTSEPGLPTVAPKPTSTGMPPTQTPLPPATATLTPPPPKSTATSTATLTPRPTAPPKPTGTATAIAPTAPAPTATVPVVSTATAQTTPEATATPPVDPTSVSLPTGSPTAPAPSATAPVGEPTWTPAPGASATPDAATATPSADSPDATPPSPRRPTIYLPYSLQMRMRN